LKPLVNHHGRVLAPDTERFAVDVEIRWYSAFLIQ
jgi:hypothetical protein